ncbi:17903_t:CDS:2 [Funneliformis caledonium]|uniref:17903_t:CDS:1 n=2 Tax=Funneliformis TaxID=1117308 RepID=A0A9N8VAP3_9GLOM|nr:17903_t:CDS:2 [Funneliformis caledonium]CAG8637089.1 16498_t:CDS:2 [Funneliformis mosseae]
MSFEQKEKESIKITTEIEETAEASELQPTQQQITANVNDDDSNDNSENKNNHNDSAPQTSSKFKKFVVGNEESPDDYNYSTSHENAKDVVENHRDTKSRYYKPYPAEEIAKIAEEKRKAQQIESDDKEPVKDTVNTNHTSAIQIQSESQTPQQQTIQQPTPKEENAIRTNSFETSKPTSESHQAASPVATTVTATTQQQPTTSVPLAKQSILSTPAESPDSTPIPSLLENIHDASYHFLADDENYLIHPRNQLRLTKVIERINREHAAILLCRDPIIESLQRVWPKYVQEHPEVLDDDFGVGYEDAKDWGGISDHGKNSDQIVSNSIINNELGVVDSMNLRGIR